MNFLGPQKYSSIPKSIMIAKHRLMKLFDINLINRKTPLSTMLCTFLIDIKCFTIYQLIEESNR